MPARRIASAPRIGVAIGDAVLDVAAVADLIDVPAARAASAACAGPHLNALMERGPDAWAALRARAVAAAACRCDDAHGATASRAHLIPLAAVDLSVPVKIGNFTDFFASIFHATNTGRMFRPDNPLLPNYKHVPVAYHGRASSIRASGTPVRRPAGPDEAAR